MKKIRILIVVGISQYGVLEGFSRDLREGFLQAGCIVDWMDISPLKEITREFFVRFKNREYDFVIVFNNMAIFLSELFVRNSSTIFWSFLVDPPLYQLERLQSFSGNAIVSCIDENHVAYVRKELKHLPYVTFMPHGGSRPKEIIPYENRKRQVVFFGSCPDIVALEEKLSREAEPMRSVLERILHRTYGEEKDFADIVEEELDFAGKGFTEYQRKLGLLRCMYIHQLARGMKRLHLLELLGASGVEVEVYGNGWDSYDNQYSEYIHVRGPVDYEEALQIMVEAKIVLNNIPLYVNGSHERVFTAMRCGSVSFSEENAYFRRCFEENREIIFFSYNDPYQIPGKLKFLLEHDKLAENIAEAGREKVERLHTWESRAKEMLGILIDIKKEQNHQDAFQVKVCSECDEAFNRLIFRICGMEEGMLYETMKENLLRDALFSSGIEEALECSLARYPYWGELRVREGIFEVCQQRAYQVKHRMEEFVWLYGRLGDETSRKILLVLLQNWVCHTSLDQMPYVHWSQYFDLDLVHFQENEVFVDCGAYNGDTLVNFSLECRNYKKIYCYEFNDGNLKKLREKARNFPYVTVRPYAVGDMRGEVFVDESEGDSGSHLDKEEVGRKVFMVTLDEDITEAITFLKADIEGAEKQMLLGAKRHIQREKPKLAIAVYHGNSDILDIPELVEEMNPTYQFYLRYYGGTLYPNEIVLYAV